MQSYNHTVLDAYLIGHDFLSQVYCKQPWANC